MTRKIVEIKEEFNKESSVSKSAIGSGALDPLKITSFPDVVSIERRYKVYNSGHESGETVAYKYQYKGGIEYNTKAQANNERNSDIQSKIDIINGRISKCEKYISKLDKISNDCKKSIENLKKDKDELKKLIAKINGINSSISSAKTYYSRARDSIQNCFKCSPTRLNLEMGNAINYIQNQECSNENNGLSSMSDTLNKYIEQGNEIIKSITDLKGKLQEKKSKLNTQKSQFESLKR